jgi:pyruvate kinase
MRPQIMVTLGPSSLNEETVKQCAQEDIFVFRLNMSHTQLETLEESISKIQGWTDTPLCLDSEGAQLRSGVVKGGKTTYCKGEAVKIHFDPVEGDAANISFTPIGVTRQFVADDRIKIDFDRVVIRVSEVHADHCMAVVKTGGTIESRKAADLNREPDLIPITQKDRDAIEIGRKMGLKHFALSFANNPSDVRQMRELCGSNACIISKIESRASLHNLEDIIRLSDQILVDRGDLSRQVPIDKVPFLQRRIISIAKSQRVPINVATNLLESMVTTHTPTRAEVNDVVSTLLMGADGLVLAAETAIGKYPVDAVKMIRLICDQFGKWTPNTSIGEILDLW